METMDSHSFRNVRKNVNISYGATQTLLVPAQHGWNPNEAGTEFVTIGTVLGPTEKQKK